MTIEISDEDVIKSLAAYRESESWNPHWGSSVGMRAALESFVARHPELPPQRAMHEPVTEEEFRAMMRAIYDSPRGFGCGYDVRAALDDLLARRAAPKPEPVVVTEEMRQACAKAFGWEGGAMSDVIWHAMNWRANYFNSKNETKPVDPRIRALQDAIGTMAHITDKHAAEILAQIDEAVAQQA